MPKPRRITPKRVEQKSSNRYAPKFPDCVTCRFFNPAHCNPMCGECDAGEFYEEKIRIHRPTNDELMREYRNYYDE